ncbi:hypothetical protein C8R45DRAFT_970092 [Mycena sanguinolenta]|nr:hypothetical protein C8R45DRAFT_970092 [Mycena sanguinolenta]
MRVVHVVLRVCAKRGTRPHLSRKASARWGAAAYRLPAAVPTRSHSHPRLHLHRHRYGRLDSGCGGYDAGPVGKVRRGIRPGAGDAGRDRHRPVGRAGMPRCRRAGHLVRGVVRTNSPWARALATRVCRTAAAAGTGESVWVLPLARKLWSAWARRRATGMERWPPWRRRARRGPRRSWRWRWVRMRMGHAAMAAMQAMRMRVPRAMVAEKGAPWPMQAADDADALGKNG